MKPLVHEDCAKAFEDVEAEGATVAANGAEGVEGRGHGGSIEWAVSLDDAGFNSSGAAARAASAGARWLRLDPTRARLLETPGAEARREREKTRAREKRARDRKRKEKLAKVRARRGPAGGRRR